MSEISLNDFQAMVVEQINSYDEFTGEQDVVIASNYEQNRMSKIQICLRKGSGHSTLTGYLAKKYPSLVIYWDLDHYKEIEHLTEFDEDEDWHKDTEFISLYELRHDIMLSSKADLIRDGLERIKDKFKGKKIIVMDKASDVIGRWPEITEFIYTVSEGSAIVLLG